MAMEDQESTPAWRYTGSSSATEPAGAGASSPAPVSRTTSVKWTALEYIAQDKGPAWFVAYGLVVFIIAAAIWLITESYLSLAFMLILSIGFGVYAARKPQMQEFEVNGSGVRFAGKFYSYNQFRSFALVQDGAVPSVWLMPLQKLRPPLIMYFAPAEGEKIMDILEDYLPHEQKDYDMLERLMRYIRF
jgi:hypothetical protein